MMRKCQVVTVPAYVIQLADHCEKEVFFNWSHFLCSEFLENVREAQDHGKEFYCSWLLLLIALVTWEAPEDLVLPELEPEMCEGERYVNLWDSKDEHCLKDCIKTFVVKCNVTKQKSCIRTIFVMSNPHQNVD